MSAILSAETLNDFISPGAGVACIVPIETLPESKVKDPSNPYEVTTEDKVTTSKAAPAQISLTDCLACSGCVTSAEAVLVSLQSHNEVLNTLDAYPSIHPASFEHDSGGAATLPNGIPPDGRIFVASVSPQVRASLAATYGVSEQEAGYMIEHLLKGPNGLASGGKHGSSFSWIIDTNLLKDVALVAAADEVMNAISHPETAPEGEEGSISVKPKKPILTSACPGWICYVEKTHPYVLPHLSRLKSPQALTGTLVKSVLYKRLGIPPEKIWHLALMPCFDKKLEASRSELTSAAWLPSTHGGMAGSDVPAVRDVDCVITSRELLHLAAERDISFESLPRTPLLSPSRVPFPDSTLDAFLFPRIKKALRTTSPPTAVAAGSSDGYLYHILQTYQSLNPGSEIRVERGRNSDVVDYKLVRGNEEIIRMARYYGFRNIQNLVRRLKPVKQSRMPGARMGGARKPGGAGVSASGGSDYAYVEVMACPGGCTNGGGQIKVADLANIRGDDVTADSTVQGVKPGPKEQKEWLARVDEAYFSAESDEDTQSSSEDEEMRDVNTIEFNRNGNTTPDIVNGISKSYISNVLDHWVKVTGVDSKSLLYTSYRKVQSDVGKKVSDVERVAGLASSIGGGW